MRPWIGISCWQHPENLEFFVPEAYVQSVRGVDIDSLYWGEEPLRQMGRIDPSLTGTAGAAQGGAAH
ncbi:MAG: hypothetical protein M1602_05345 [Firmicutes bacterium]|nr:hypothetical protein [Bacillota bacterium]